MLKLAPDEVVVDRPFTHVQNHAADLTYLEHARSLLRELLQTQTLEENRLVHLETDAPDGAGLGIESRGGYRLLIINRAPLLGDAPLSVVGFCGHKRADISEDVLDEMSEVDAKLIEEMRAQDHMLSYCSVERADGNWCNLVIVRTPQGIDQWRNGHRHGHAVDTLSPQFYQWVRLHNGVLPHGLASPRIQITRTKYYDFGDGREGTREEAYDWRAVRELE